MVSLLSQLHRQIISQRPLFLSAARMMPGCRSPHGTLRTSALQLQQIVTIVTLVKIMTPVCTVIILINHTSDLLPGARNGTSPDLLSSQNVHDQPIVYEGASPLLFQQSVNYIRVSSQLV